MATFKVNVHNVTAPVSGQEQSLTILVSTAAPTAIPHPTTISRASALSVIILMPGREQFWTSNTVEHTYKVMSRLWKKDLEIRSLWKKS